MAFLINSVRAADINIDAPVGFEPLINITIGSMVKGVISFLLIIAALVFFIMLVLGGIKWIMSEGDETKVKNARNQVQHALIGLVVVFAAWAIIKLIESVFGINLLQGFNFPTFY